MGTISVRLARVQALLARAISHHVAPWVAGLALVLALGVGAPAAQSAMHVVSVAHTVAAHSGQVARMHPFPDCPGSGTPC
jgi:uncharacterized membrane protein